MHIFSGPITLFRLLVGVWLFAACQEKEVPYLQISGIYPHLAVFNQPPDSLGRLHHRECGIGAVVPWAGHLWYITYPPHQRQGSNDRLYMIDSSMNLTVRPESVGGTHANRMIHRESRQLIIGPYFIDTSGNVRVADLKQLEGRLTATTRHLFHPDSLVYFVDMEGIIYEVNVYDLSIHKLFQKPVPGWHGKGAYVAQGRLIIANNGEHEGHSMGYEHLLVGGPAQNREEAGVLAEWDGTTWRIIDRLQFTEVTGPGGLKGNLREDEPAWSTGWDKRSVILRLLENGTWYRYRLPKASFSYDPRHGWFTEWPRIRAVSDEEWLMTMHGTLFAFPPSFRTNQSEGIQPVSTHLRYIPDFTGWKGQVILAADEASTLQNPLVGQPQSNLWFGSYASLRDFGPRQGWGGPWLYDSIQAGQLSDPYLFRGYGQKMVHLINHGKFPVQLTLERDIEGQNKWEYWKSVQMAADEYRPLIFDRQEESSWIRLSTDRNTRATAYFHYHSPDSSIEYGSLFTGLAGIDEEKSAVHALLRPAGHNRSLQVYFSGDETYREVEISGDQRDLIFHQNISDRSEEIIHLSTNGELNYELDEASLIIQNYDGQRLRLPRGSGKYESIWKFGRPRLLREVQSERYLANIHGVFYEVPRAEGAGNHIPDFSRMKPVARHDRQITDYCSWRGLLVLSGVRQGATEDGHIFKGTSDEEALWFGAVDDLWCFGKPTGSGGVWKNSEVKAHEYSDPFLMTGFDKKRLEISIQNKKEVVIKVEVSVYPSSEMQWFTYREIRIPQDGTIEYIFPGGFSAFWVRLQSQQDCRISAIFHYE